MGTPMSYISGNTGDFSSGSFNRATVALNLQNQLVSGYNWWNGVDVTASQYLIYSDLYSQGQSTLANSRPTAWTTPDLTDASLLGLINTLPDRVGLPPYTDVNLALNWLQATNKYFLIKTGYENISTTNLSINLDAGWYTSYSGGTSWRDIVGNGDNGVLTNGPVFTASAQGVISFDGTDDYVVVSPVNTITLNDYTMEVWFNIASLPSKRQYLIDPRGNGTENNSPIYFLFDDNGSQINIIGGNNNIEVSSGNLAAQTNTWYHAICTRNGSTCTLYFNGVKVGEGNTGSSPLTIYHPFRVATFAGGTSGQYFFNGKISMARIYSNGFSGSDVQKNYNSQRNRFGLLDVVQNGLISSIDAGNFLSYPTTGTVWKDLSGYEDNFTLTNGPTWNSSNGGFITFDGTDDYCATAAGAPFYQYTNKLSVSWWMKRNGTIAGGAGGGQSTIGVDGMSTNVWLMHGNGSSMTFYVNDSGSWVSLDSGTIPDNTWTHLVATVSNTATKFYVNGVLINATSGVSQITINPNSIIGWGFDPRYLTGRFFNGSIHNAQVYNRELSSDEVYQNYSTNIILDGSTSTKAAPSAKYLWNNGFTTNGLYYIQTSSGPVQVYCDLTTLDEDGTSGWMLVGSWDNSYEWTLSANSTAGVLNTTPVNSVSSNFGNTNMNRFRVHVASSISNTGSNANADFYYNWNAATLWKEVWAPDGTLTYYYLSQGVNPQVARASIKPFNGSYNIKDGYLNSNHTYNNISDYGYQNTQLPGGLAAVGGTGAPAAGLCPFWAALTTAGNTFGVYCMGRSATFSTCTSPDFDGTLAIPTNGAGTDTTGQDVDSNVSAKYGYDDGGVWQSPANNKMFWWIK